jgi:hypothetical protein
MSDPTAVLVRSATTRCATTCSTSCRPTDSTAAPAAAAADRHAPVAGQKHPERKERA